MPSAGTAGLRPSGCQELRRRRARKNFAQIGPRKFGPKCQALDSEPDQLGQPEFSPAVKSAECAPADLSLTPALQGLRQTLLLQLAASMGDKRVGPAACAPRQPIELEVS